MRLLVSSALFLGCASLAMATAPTYPGYAVTLGGAVNINQSIQITGQLGYQTAGGGGEFSGTLNGVAAAFWCVDDQEAFGFGQSGLANVTRLDQISQIDPSATRYGNVTSTSDVNNPGQWLNTGGNLSNFTTAADRYRLTAYLVSQYQGFDTSIDGSTAALQNQANAIQQAIWAITNTTLPQGALNGSIYTNAYRSVTATTGPDPVNDSVAYWIDQATQHVGQVNPLGWAVVSWGADSAGNLYYGSYSAAQSTNQTFLVELTGQPGLSGSLAPEPGFYGVLAVGLGALIFVVRRKRQA